MISRELGGHGTRACYLRGCRRQACVDANRRYCKQYRVTTLHKGPRRIDAATVAAACRGLAAEGWSERQIAAAAGCSEGAVHHLLAGRQRTVNPRTAAAILRATPGRLSVAPWTYVEATGTIRRGRALVAMGYQVKDIADEVGMAHDPLSRILNRDPATVRARTAQSMTAVCARLSRTPGPSQRSRDYAASRGWHSLAAWDYDIDDPAAKPNTTGLLRPLPRAA